MRKSISYFSSTVFFLGVFTKLLSVAQADTIGIDIRNYITQTAGGNMLCDSNPNGILCMQGA